MPANRRLSGTQLTVIAVAICVAVVGAPIGVWAAASVVTIADPVHPSQKAHVNASGQLVTTVAGPVALKGTPDVLAAPAAPGRPFTASDGIAQVAQFTVPTGKHLVGETFSVSLTTPHGNGPFAVTLQFVSHGTTGHPWFGLPMTYTSANTNVDYYLLTTATRFYADPGTDVSVQVDDPSGASYASNYTVVGYLT